MAEEKRDLEFFMANPDQMPGNLDELEAALTAQTGGETKNEPAPTGENSAASGAAGKEEAAKTGEAAQAAAVDKVDQAQNVVKSKDGKHEIPYAVLVSEREGRRTAEAAVEQMRQRLEALEQAARGQPAAQVATETEPELTTEELDQIESDFPAVGKLLKGLAAKVTAVTNELQAVRESESSRRQNEATKASTTVQEAIDNSDQLSFWQQKDPAMFDIAVKFDNQVKADPRNKGLSLDQRFEKVVAAVEAVYGVTELPEEFRRSTPAQPSAAAVKTAPAVDPKVVAAAAQKAIEAAQATSAVKSLSDIPGGIAPEADEISQLGLMSAADLGAKFMNMDPAKVMAILARSSA